MSGLENRTDFENEWQKAFANAEVEPSEEVWTRIDASLANKEVAFYKRKAFYYKLVAAASVVFAVTFGILAYFGNFQLSKPIAIQSDYQVDFGTNNHENQITDNQAESGDVAQSMPGVRRSAITTPEKPQQSEPQQNVLKSEKSPAIQASDSGKPGAEPAITHMLSSFEEGSESGIQGEGSHEGRGGLLSVIEKKGIEGLPVGISLREQHINRVIDPKSLFAITNKETSPQNLWAGISLAGGNFNPEFSGGSINQTYLNAMPASFYKTSGSSWYENTNSGLVDYSVIPESYGRAQVSNTISNKSEPVISYSLGFNLGGKITRKLVWQSGLFYAKRATTTTTSAFMMDDANNIYPLHISNLSLAATKNYSMFNYQFSNFAISNDYQFISVPVKIGYALLDRKFGAVLFSGISSEFFISNKIEDQGYSRLESMTIKPGPDSPYRSIWFNGLVSMEFNYNFGRMFKAYIEPAYRISLNSFTKPDYIFTSYPKSFNVAVGLKFDLD